jgi:hypothetical protein
MPNVYDGNTFSEVYKDDYAESDGYHRVLFNSGRALQARELTQLQTILQQQITSFGENIFLDGASVNPKSAGVKGSTVDYVKVFRPVMADLQDLVGTFYRRISGSTELEFQVTHVVEQPSDDTNNTFIRIYGRYVQDSIDPLNPGADTQERPVTFEVGDELADVFGINNPTLDFNPNLTVHPNAPLGINGVPDPGGPAVGEGFVVSTESTKFFTQGFFVFAPNQTIVGSEFNPKPDLDVGFEVVQDIITVEDTEDLYDNQGVRPNLSSPGADRYRIRLNLTIRQNMAENAEGLAPDFVSFAKIRDGQVVQVKEGNENYNQIEKRMATRHHDTHGDFIVNPFTIRYEEGPDSVNAAEHGIDRIVTDNFVLTIPAPVNSLNPTAFVNGYHLEHEVDQSFLVSKPLSSVVVDNLETSVDYNNYVKVFDEVGGFDSGIAPFFYDDETDLNHQRLVALVDDLVAGDTIGTARIKTIKKQGVGEDGYRVHLYDINMFPAQNFRNVKRIAQLQAGQDDPALFDNDRAIEPVLEDNQLFINDGFTNTNLFPITGGRVKELTNIDFTAQRYFTDNSGASSFTINTNAVNQKFDEVASWIVIDENGGNPQVLTYADTWTDNGSANNSSTATITAAGRTGPFHIYAQVEKTSTSAMGSNHTVKNYTEGNFMAYHQGSATDDWRVEDTTSPDDLLYDGVRLISANLDSPNGRDVTDLVNFDGGQTDNFYGPVTLKRAGLNGTNNIVVRVGYFEWENNGDYICANSYTDRIRSDETHPQYDSDHPLFFYSDIPIHTLKTNGKVLPLENYFDFRSRLDPRSTETQIPRFHLPMDNGTISYTAEFYNQRFDTICLGYSKDTLKPEFRIYSGNESLNPVVPEQKDNEMKLFTVMMNGNTKNTEDLVIEQHKYKGYKMKAIEEVEDRLARLEETVSLSFLEQNAAQLVELASDGSIRSKTGFFVDDFTKGFAFTSSFLQKEYIDDQRFATQTLDLDNANVLPKVNYESITMLHDDSDNLAGSVFGASADIKTAGDNIYLDYVDVLDKSMSQEMISWYSDGRSSEEQGWYNVNPYNVFTGEGSVKLSPGSDYWQEQRRLPNNIIDGGTVERVINPGLVPRTTTSTYRRWSVGPLNGNPAVEWAWQATTVTTTRVTRRQPVLTRVIGSETIRQDLGDRTVGVFSVPWMRQRRVYGIAEGLRPNTRYWPFFDGVNVSQWVKRIEASDYNDALRTKKHLTINVPDVSVGATEHPDGPSALVTDNRGQLWFDYVIPNTAKIPTPNSNTMNSVEDWDNWIREQKRQAKLYGSAKDPQVYNQVGWKFRTGSLPFKLLDISVDNEDACLSKARTTYTAFGQLNLKQRQILSTRVIVKENYLGNPITVGSSTTSTTTVRWYDPLAQTFLIDAELGLPGAYVTKVDVFIRRAPTVSQPQIPLQLQVRAVNNGYPVSGAISSQHRKFLSAEEVRDAISGMNPEDHASVLAHPVTFEFDEPFFLEAGTEYALCLLSECDNYEAYVATTYGLMLGKTTERVSKQPSKGSLFLSQNGSTWTAKQNQDMAYRIYTAKFKQEGNTTFYNQPYGRFKHNDASTIIVDSDLSTMRVVHPGHGLGVGDRPELLGLDSGQTYLGLAGSIIMDPSLEIVNADVTGYTLQPSQPFTSSGSFGDVDLYSNHAFNFNEATIDFQNVMVPQTNVEMKGSFVQGVSHNMIEETAELDARFDVISPAVEVTNRKTNYFPSPRILAAAYQEDENPLSASIQVQATLKTTQSSNFGIDQNNQSVYDAGYIADVSPYIDTQRLFVNATDFMIDNQPRDGEPDSLLTNTPVGYTPESHPTLGTSPSKHITGPISLEEPANGIKVLLDAYKPQNASFDVYYRTTPSTDADIYEKSWIYAEPENSPPNSPLAYGDDREFNEYTYLIGGKDGDLDDFSQFQLKVVFRSTNSSEIPILESIRTIALI